MRKPFDLPEPDPAARAHSASVEALVRRRIREAGGWIDFAEYMDTVLYAPGLGYYSAGSAKLGPAGDFVTAPEISPLFARCVARALAAALAAAPGGVVLELGAGSGVLVAGLLDALDRLGAAPARYIVLEVSADLRERQRETIARLAPRWLPSVEWLDRLPESPVSGVVLANEVADALPASRFVVRRGEVLALGACVAGDRLAWGERPAEPRLRAAVDHVQRSLGRPWPDGYASEICMRLPAWVAAIGASLAGGAVLLFDYGMSRREYYHPDRRDGTLVCHYRHRAHGDVFLHPGLQDVTAWVDFTAVAEAAEAAGLDVCGYATQAHFLLDAGLEEELRLAGAAGGAGPLALAGQARKLLLPGEMGERFKVMALGRGAPVIPGFGFRDLRHLL